jgi:hypothetical protein
LACICTNFSVEKCTRSNIYIYCILHHLLKHP